MSPAGVMAKGRRRAPAIHRVFLYLPLEHSEFGGAGSCVALFDELSAEAGAQEIDSPVMPGRTAMSLPALAAFPTATRFSTPVHRAEELAWNTTAVSSRFAAQWLPRAKCTDARSSAPPTRQAPVRSSPPAGWNR